MPHTVHSNKADKLIGRKGNIVQDQLAPVVVDEGDPLYDSEEEDYILEEVDISKTRQHPEISSYTSTGHLGDKPVLNFADYVRRATGIIEDYLTSGDSAEAVDAVKQLDCRGFLDEFVARTVRIALDRPDDQQRNASALLTLLYDAHTISRPMLMRGFEKLVQIVDDLKLDVPDVASRLLGFIDDAIRDGSLGKDFTSRLPESFFKALPQEALQKDPSLASKLKTLQASKLVIDEILHDAFDGCGEEEFKKLLKGVDPSCRHEVVRKLLTLSLEKTDRMREMTSSFFSSLYGKELKPDDLTIGFCRVVGSLEDLTLDNPKAPGHLINFLVRAVVDEVLPPVFVKDLLRLRTGLDAGARVLKRVQKLLAQGGKCLVSRYRKVWTGVDPTSAEAMAFKEELKQTILEYFDSLDVKEAKRCFKKMEMSPAQAAEAVRKCIYFAIERTGRECDAVLTLLCYLFDEGELSRDELEKGFDQAYLNLPEMKLDVPDAGEMLASFIDQAREKALLSSRYDPSTASTRP